MSSCVREGSWFRDLSCVQGDFVLCGVEGVAERLVRLERALLDIDVLISELQAFRRDVAMYMPVFHPGVTDAVTDPVTPL